MASFPSISAARDETISAVTESMAMRQNREAWEAPFRGIDVLVARLEELNIEGRQRVPMNMAPALEELIAMLPPRLQPSAAVSLRPKVRVTRLLDELFRFQQELLFLRSGDSFSG